jgi:hypothetical protein
MAEASPSQERAPARRPGLVARALILGVRGYQVFLGPLLGGHCRFTPSCSFYGIEALTQHGAHGLLVKALAPRLLENLADTLANPGLFFLKPLDPFDQAL